MIRPDNIRRWLLHGSVALVVSGGGGVMPGWEGRKVPLRWHRVRGGRAACRSCRRIWRRNPPPFHLGGIETSPKPCCFTSAVTAQIATMLISPR